LGNGPLPNFRYGWNFVQLGNGQLPDSEQLRVFIEELNHEFQVSRGKTLLLCKFILQIGCQPRDDTATPPRLPLTGGDHAANVPVEMEHLRIGGEGGTGLGLADAGFDVAKEVSIEGELGLVHRDKASRS